MWSIQILRPSPNELVIVDPGYSGAAWALWALAALLVACALASLVFGSYLHRWAGQLPLASALVTGSTWVMALVLLLVAGLLGWAGWRLKNSSTITTLDRSRNTIRVAGGYFRTDRKFGFEEVRKAQVTGSYEGYSVALEVQGQGLVQITGVSNRSGMGKAAEAINEFIGR